MTLRRVFIQTRDYIPEVAEVLGMNPIDIEYEFEKAQIREEVYSFEVDTTPQQAAELNRRARRGRTNG